MPATATAAPARGAFKLIDPPSARGVIPDPSPDVLTSHGKHVPEADRQRWHDLTNAVESADVPGVGVVDKVAARCRCGTRVFYFAAESGPFRSPPGLCPGCEFAAALDLTERESGGVTTVTPESFDLVGPELARLEADFPSVYAAMQAAGTLPAPTPHVQPGAKRPWTVAYVARSPSAPRIDLFRPVRDGLFGLGDFGVLGKAADAELIDAGRWCPEFLGPAGRNALAFERGEGLILARYDLTPAEREGVAFHTGQPHPPAFLVEVVGLLTAGTCRVLCRRFSP